MNRRPSMDCYKSADLHDSYRVTIGNSEMYNEFAKCLINISGILIGDQKSRIV
jgi:hypothetical protein